MRVSRREIVASIVARYLGALTVGPLLYVLRDRLPYAQPALSIVFASLCAWNTLALLTLPLLERVSRRGYVLGMVVGDLAFTFGFLHFTGGYLSPFVVSLLLTVVGANKAFLTERRASIATVAVVASGLVGMTALHRSRWLPCPVGYVARLIEDDVFFYCTFPVVVLLFLAGAVLVRGAGSSSYATITGLLATNQRLVADVARGSPRGTGPDFLRRVADTFAADRAFLLPTTSEVAARVAGEVWPEGAGGERWGDVGTTDPARYARAHGACLVPSGARRAFPQCAWLRSTATDGLWISALRDDAGDVIGLLGVTRTAPLELDHKSEFVMQLFTVLGQTALQRRLAEHANEALREQLGHARKMEALGQLAGGVAHDFNNLLTVILGANEVLRSCLDDPAAAESFSRDIDAAGRRAADLVRSLLTFARRAPTDRAPVELHATLSEVERLLAHTLDRRITLELDLAASSSTVVGDASQIQNALLNVALNARDAMPDGGSIVFSTADLELDRAALERRALALAPGPYLEVTCRDTGAGIAPEILDRVFDPFFTTKEPGRGTGLGLAAVYGCLQAHGGAVAIESTVGSGTLVRMLLPVRELSPTRESAAPDGPVSARRGDRLLVAEDEAMVADLLAKMLRAADFEVDLCPDGAEAVARYRAEPDRYALVVLDVIMPELDGRQVFDTLCAVNPRVRCVFVSGYSDEGRLEPLLSTGRCGFVQKPFQQDRLVATIRAELERTDASLVVA